MLNGTCVFVGLYFYTGGLFLGGDVGVAKSFQPDERDVNRIPSRFHKICIIVLVSNDTKFTQTQCLCCRLGHVSYLAPIWWHTPVYLCIEIMAMYVGG